MAKSSKYLKLLGKAVGLSVIRYPLRSRTLAVKL